MRLTGTLFGLLCLFTAGQVYAAPPPEDTIQACLYGENVGRARWAEIPTGEVALDDDFPGGYKATLFKANGRNVGYAEKEGQAGLVWGRTVTPLKNAIALNKPPQDPAEFSPLLATWALIRQDDQRFVCVNFNFDGLGRSGSFQRVHGLYLLSTQQKGRKPLPLFFDTREQ